MAILGSEGDDLVSSEDTIADRNHAIAFAAEARVQQRLEFDSARTTAVLIVGADDWPMPIPIVQQGGKWSLRCRGREGRDPPPADRRRTSSMRSRSATATSTPSATTRFTRRDGSIVNQYAQRVISTPGKQDGLAWRAADGTWQGPMGETIAKYIAEGYSER